MLSVADCLNKVGPHKVKLVHISGFVNFLDGAIQDLVAPADIIIFQRNVVHQQVFDAIEYWRGHGKPVAIDLDDAYQILPWSNPAHAFWIENSTKQEPPPLVMLEDGLKRFDGLIAPNRLLLEDWKHVTRGYYLPNYAQMDWWSGIPSREDLKKPRNLNNRIVIGWGGSVSHYDSWWGSGIREAATKVCQRHPEVVWLICGNDKRIYDQLPVPWSQKLWQSGVPPQEWPKIVSIFDIGVAPLYGIYDQRRSWIKGLEYGLAGVPWIGTEGEPYSDLAGLGMLVKGGSELWEIALEQMIMNLPALQEVSRRNIPMYHQWFIENQVATYERVYSDIIADSRARSGQLPGVLYFAGGRAAKTPEVL